MPIAGAEDYRMYEEARTELTAQLARPRGRDFYSRKIGAVWQRARHSSAYRHLDDFALDRFFDLAPTDRRDLKSRPLDFLAVPLKNAFKYYETTGTTGQPTPTPRLQEDVIWNTVSVAEAWRAILAPDDRILVMLPSDIVPVADLIVGVSEYLKLAHAKAYPFTTGISDWDRLDSFCQNFQPTVLFIAPGVAQQFTRVLKQRGTFARLSESVRTIMLLGEVNTPAFRKRLGEWWGARAYDASYGSTETGTLSASCADGQQHLLVAANYFEVDAGSGPESLPLDRSIHGRLVVTPLNLHARPFLRLDTGDVVTVSRGCPCGSEAPCVVVHGRSSDGIQLQGTSITVRALEEVVYSATHATGYLVETTEQFDYARLVLERGTDWDRSVEPTWIEDIQRVSAQTLHVTWDDIAFVNTLPVTTKSGGSQKSWKRSNLRIIKR